MSSKPFQVPWIDFLERLIVGADKEWLRRGLLVGLVGLAYSRALSVYFLGDDWTIFYTPGIWSFSETHTLFRPLPAWTMQGLYAFIALRMPWVYHLASVLLHTVVPLLLSAIAKRLFCASLLVLSAALLFGLRFAHADPTYWLAAVDSLLERVCSRAALLSSLPFA